MTEHELGGGGLGAFEPETRLGSIKRRFNEWRDRRREVRRSAEIKRLQKRYIREEKRKLSRAIWRERIVRAQLWFTEWSHLRSFGESAYLGIGDGLRDVKNFLTRWPRIQRLWVQVQTRLASLRQRARQWRQNRWSGWKAKFQLAYQKARLIASRLNAWSLRRKADSMRLERELRVRARHFRMYTLRPRWRRVQVRWRFARRFILGPRLSSLARQLRVRKYVIHRRARLYLRENAYAIAGLVALVALFIWVAMQLDNSAKGAFQNIGSFLQSVPVYVWWGLSALAILFALWYFWPRGGQGQQTTGSMGTALRPLGPWILGTAKLAIAIALIFYFSGSTREWMLDAYKRSGLANTSVQAATVPVPTATMITNRNSILGLPADTVLSAIADCESGLRDLNNRAIPGSARQLDDKGNVITRTNTNGTVDRGKYQINSTHDAEIAQREINIMTEAGNEEFARILYAREGTTPWNSSRECWEQTLLPLVGGSASVQRLVLRPGEPGKISVLPGWRWDIRKPIPTGWTTDNGSLDSLGNRIQVFEVVTPAEEVVLTVDLTKCSTPQSCAW